MANAETNWDADPVASYLFGLRVGDTDMHAIFSAASGLSEANAAVFVGQHHNKNKPQIKKVPGNYSWADITLKRGITTNEDLWAWRQKVVDGDMSGARQDGSITIYSPDLTPVAVWSFVRGWPSKWLGGELSSESDEVFIEELVITCEGSLECGQPSDRAPALDKDRIEALVGELGRH